MRDDITDEQIELFWSKVKPFTALDACWIWAGQTHHNAGKYGTFRWRAGGGKRIEGRAHRIAYQLLVGDPGETLDHLCRNTLCVNPDHLEPVSIRENLRRGFPGPRRRLADGVPVCPSGHEITGHNAMPQRRGRSVCCRICSYAAQRRHKERKSAA